VASVSHHELLRVDIAMIGYQGTVFPVLLAVWFMSIVEKVASRYS
jgi:PTS system sucrose-specific IIC component